MLDSNQLSLVNILASSHSTYVSLHYTPCFNCKSKGPCQGPPSLRCENIKSRISFSPFITHNAPLPTSNATIAGSKNISTMFSPPIYSVFHLKKQKKIKLHVSTEPIFGYSFSFNHTFIFIFGFFL
jgi:hypothetical protein